MDNRYNQHGLAPSNFSSHVWTIVNWILPCDGSRNCFTALLRYERKEHMIICNVVSNKALL